VDAWAAAALPAVEAASAAVVTASEAVAAGAWAETSEVRPLFVPTRHAPPVTHVIRPSGKHAALLSPGCHRRPRDCCRYM